MPGTTARLDIRGEFLPLTQTPASEAAVRGLRRGGSRRGPEVDGRVLRRLRRFRLHRRGRLPDLCAVGPVGGNAHTAEEFLELDSMVPRAQALALAILSLPPLT